MKEPLSPLDLCGLSGAFRAQCCCGRNQTPLLYERAAPFVCRIISNSLINNFSCFLTDTMLNLNSQMGESQERRDIFNLSRDWLSVQEVVNAVSSSSCGAISLFIGTTREDKVDGRMVIGLEYEAYERMVQSEFTKLCADIRERWPTVRHICVHHRLGWVEVGQASVVMAISSPHRHDGQRAIERCIEQLKANIPIWKKEVYDTQDSSWKQNTECSWAAHNNLDPVTSSTEN